MGPWLPEPLLTDPEPDPSESVLLAESLTFGVLTVLERLEPVERAVFLLREVFDEPYADIASTVGRSEAACRQLVHRARERVRLARVARAAPVAQERRDELVAAFAGAIAAADVDALRQVLADDVVLVSDGGAAHHAARRPVLGSAKVARLLVNTAKRVPSNADFTLVTVNHQPAFLVHRHGRPILLTVLEVCADGVAGVQVVVNPDKLGSVAALASAREHGR